MSNHFTINELIKSDTANKHHIDNTPTEEIKGHLNELIGLLEDFRTSVGCPIRITSGYRCPQLNELVKGKTTSAHLIGYAADMMPIGIAFDEFKDRAMEWANATNRTFDQLIIEHSKTAQWIHLGMFNQKHEQRGMAFGMYKKDDIW